MTPELGWWHWEQTTRSAVVWSWGFVSNLTRDLRDHRSSSGSHPHTCTHIAQMSNPREASCPSEQQSENRYQVPSATTRQGTLRHVKQKQLFFFNKNESVEEPIVFRLHYYISQVKTQNSIVFWVKLHYCSIQKCISDHVNSCSCCELINEDNAKGF